MISACNNIHEIDVQDDDVLLLLSDLGKYKNEKRMASPGFEPETFSVLDWRDNQLHHETNLM